MLTLGCVVSSLLGKSLRMIFLDDWEDEEETPPSSQPAEHSEQAPDDLASGNTSNLSRVDIAKFRFSKVVCNLICRFPNKFNNCWLNATFHSALNLTVVQQRLRYQSPSALAEFSTTPTTAKMFLKALSNPGRVFTTKEIYVALLELSGEKRILRLLESNDVLDFLAPFLVWLDKCGVGTSIQVEEKTRCQFCDSTSVESSCLGSVCFLPPPCVESESVSSLLSRGYCKKQNDHRCSTCGSTLLVKRSFNCADVLTLYLPRRLPDGSVLQNSVPSCETIQMTSSDNEKLPYKLSSIICYNTGHFWTYLFRSQCIIKADDSRVTVLTDDKPEDINTKGIVYIYEKASNHLQQGVAPTWEGS